MVFFLFKQGDSLAYLLFREVWLECPMKKIKIACLGECMLELSQAGEASYQLGFAGDTYNTAVYWRRYTENPSEFYYVSALGDDAYSQKMRSAFITAGIEDTYVRNIVCKQAGLYFIDTDLFGERHFTYYRSQSAAREMFDGPEGAQLLARLFDFDTLYFSSISLAILTDSGRAAFLAMLPNLRAHGCQIVFDTNYRPRLWANRLQAEEVILATLPHVDIGLPSFFDEALLWNDADMHQTAMRWLAAGVGEVVVKNGAENFLVATPSAHQVVSVAKPTEVVDTTAAGDSFNGAYLARRMAGDTQVVAAEFATQVAATVVGFKGAFAKS